VRARACMYIDASEIKNVTEKAVQELAE